MFVRCGCRLDWCGTKESKIPSRLSLRIVYRANKACSSLLLQRNSSQCICIWGNVIDDNLNLMPWHCTECFFGNAATSGKINAITIIFGKHCDTHRLSAVFGITRMPSDRERKADFVQIGLRSHGMSFNRFARSHNKNSWCVCHFSDSKTVSVSVSHDSSRSRGVYFIAVWTHDVNLIRYWGN